MPDDFQDQPDQTVFAISEDDFNAAVSPPNVKGRINLRIEKALEEEIENISEDSRYPLRSVSEVVRFCCLIGMRSLRAWKPAPTLLGAIRAANALTIRDKIQSESMDLIQRMDERINWYIEHREYDEAINLVAQIVSYFDGIADDFWKRHTLQRIDEKFAQWYQSIDDAKKDENNKK